MKQKDFPKLYAVAVVLLVTATTSTLCAPPPQERCECRTIDWLGKECRPRYVREATRNYAELIRHLNTSIHKFGDLNDAFSYIYRIDSNSVAVAGNVTNQTAHKFLKRLNNAKRIKHFNLLFAKLYKYIEQLRRKKSVEYDCCQNYRPCFFDYMSARLNYAHILMNELLACRNRKSNATLSLSSINGDKMDLLNHHNTTNVTDTLNLDYTVFHLYKILNCKLRDFIMDKKPIKCRIFRRNKAKPEGDKRRKSKTPKKKRNNNNNKLNNKGVRKQGKKGLKRVTKTIKTC